MEALETILTRHSIRRYTPAPVPDSLVTEILQAAMSAPSAGNQQPWQFVVVADRLLREEIPTFHPYAQMVREAPVAILVCGDLRLESYPGHWVQDCSAATQNILLAAHAKGLGGGLGRCLSQRRTGGALPGTPRAAGPGDPACTGPPRVSRGTPPPREPLQRLAGAPRPVVIRGSAREPLCMGTGETPSAPPLRSASAAPR